MEFMKKSSKYIVEYKTREEAAEALKDDPRISEIRVFDYYDHGRCDGVSKTKYLVVETEPIVPKQIKGGFKHMVLGPVGRYVITLKQTESSEPGINIKIDGKDGPICFSMIQPHVHSSEWENICWGTAQEDISLVKNYGDWYWTIKYALDLIEDWDDEEIHELTFCMYFFFSQLNFNPKLKPKLVKCVQALYDEGEDGAFYQQYHGSGIGDGHKYDYYNYFGEFGIGNPETPEIKAERLRKEEERRQQERQNERDRNIGRMEREEKAAKLVEQDNQHHLPIRVGDRIIMKPGVGYGITVGGCEGVVESVQGRRVSVKYDKGCHGSFDVNLEDMVRIP